MKLCYDEATKTMQPWRPRYRNERKEMRASIVWICCDCGTHVQPNTWHPLKKVNH